MSALAGLAGSAGGVIGQHGALTPDQARDIARLWSAEIAASGDPAGEKQERRLTPTVGALMEQYLQTHVRVRNKPSTAAYVPDLVRRIIGKDPLARRKVPDVNEADIARFHARLAATPVTANRAHAALSKAFALAETWGYRERHSNPCTAVEKFRETPRERFLSPAEFAPLGETLAAADRDDLVLTENGKPRRVRAGRWAVAAIRLLILTGARRGEILGLRREWIDWEAGRANLPDSKTGRKPLMLPNAALDVLKDLDPPASGRGFVIRGGTYAAPETPLVNLKDPWGIIRRVAGLPDVRPRDLPHLPGRRAVGAPQARSQTGARQPHTDAGAAAAEPALVAGLSVRHLRVLPEVPRPSGQRRLLPRELGPDCRHQHLRGQGGAGTRRPGQALRQASLYRQ